MINAKHELITHLAEINKTVQDILCFHMTLYTQSTAILFSNKVHESPDSEQLDFEYNDGYGSQKLFGIIWFTDGTWSTRGEYDGSEWWEYHVVPDIPTDLK
jgi:hypothetical protein